MTDMGAYDELSAAVLAVNRQRSVKEVLQTIVGAARSLLDCAYAALGVPDEEGGFAEFVVDGVSDEQWAAIGPLPRQHGLLAAMLQDGKPQRLADVRKDPRFEWWPKAHPVLTDFLGMPIISDESVLGAIYLANSRRGAFTEADEQTLAVLAAHAAIALTNARLYERSRELTLLEERHRVARELHDAVAQKLFSLRLTAEAAAALIGSDPQRAVGELEEIKRLAALAIAELGEVVAELRPQELADVGLVETLRRRVALLDRVHAATVEFALTEPMTEPMTEPLTGPLTGPPGAVPLRVAEVVLRVVEEALHNALRHAGATRIVVALSSADGGLRCAVTDNGSGFDPEQARGLGLLSMRERARAIGGTVSVSSTPDGTTVALAVPGA